MQLDNFSKIQIAVFGIQYMANTMSILSRDIEEMGAHNVVDPFEPHLKSMCDKLSKMYEEAADVLNNHDAQCLIDANVLSVPSDILLFGKDDTEEDYYSKDIQQSSCDTMPSPPEPSPCSMVHVNALENMTLLNINFDTYGIDARGTVYEASKGQDGRYTFITVNPTTQEQVKAYYDRFFRSRI